MLVKLKFKVNVGVERVLRKKSQHDVVFVAPFLTTFQLLK